MPIRTGGTAPYAPGATVMQAITAYRERGLTTPITDEVLTRASIPESLAGRTVRSLEGLDLIDKDGKPTAEFEGLRRAPSDEFKARMEAVVRSVYAEVFQFTDPATDPPTRVADAFRAYDPPGQRARMVALFLSLCVAAGIIPESAIRKPTTPNAPKKPGSSPSKARLQVQAATRALRRAQEEDGDEDGRLPQVVQAAVASIPVNGWTAAERDRFLKFFGTVLEFAIPLRSEGSTANGDGLDDDDDDDNE